MPESWQRKQNVSESLWLEAENDGVTLGAESDRDFGC